MGGSVEGSSRAPEAEIYLCESSRGWCGAQ